MRATVAILSLLIAWPAAVLAESTSLSVMVQSRDAKFIGSGVGGTRIIVENADTGEVLAQGVTEGGTGDTDLIMRQPRDRETSLITPEAARFSTELDLAAPSRIRVTAYGPLAYPDSANTTSVTQWLFPGQDRDAEASLVLEMPGLIVDPDDMPAVVRLENGTARVPVRTMVAMMCGCPLTPDGLWDSNEFRIEARAVHDGEVVATTALDFAGEASRFEGELTLSRTGPYEVAIRAVQPRTGNAGTARGRLVVVEPPGAE